MTSYAKLNGIDYYWPRITQIEQMDTDFFLNDYKKTKCSLLAPIAVEILVSLVPKDETHKIATESGTTADEKANVSAPKN